MYYHASAQNPANWVQRWDYKYQTGTSKLLHVDSGTVALRTYTYDANGNTRTDNGHGLTSSTMNRANLPVTSVVNGKTLKNLFGIGDARVYKENVTDGKKTFYWLSSSGQTIGVLVQQNNNWSQSAWEFYAGSVRVQNGERHFSVSDHLGNKRVTYSATLNCVTGIAYTVDEADDYYPFGKTLRSFVNTTKERYTFNGNEREEESQLDYFNARYYDADICRFLAVDPKPNMDFSHYAGFENNPILKSDPLGDTTRITTKDGKFLFDLDDGQTTVTSMTAKQLYDKGVQWFEPLADNYMPLLKMANDIGTNSALKHFTWKEIGDFSKVDRYLIDYRQKGSGDWKASDDGADGMFLVTVDGKPYWADAVGQIPFAVNYYKDVFEENHDVNKSILLTVYAGRLYGEGELVNPQPDNTNGYDHYFILRGAIWASMVYAYSPTKDEIVERKDAAQPKYMEKSISERQQITYIAGTIIK